MAARYRRILVLKTGSAFPDLFLLWTDLCCRRKRQTDGSEKSIKSGRLKKLLKLLKIFKKFLYM